MDEDGDGVITKPEFLNFVLKSRNNKKFNNISSYYNNVLDPLQFKALAESTSDNEARYLGLQLSGEEQVHRDCSESTWGATQEGIVP